MNLRICQVRDRHRHFVSSKRLLMSGISQPSWQLDDHAVVTCLLDNDASSPYYCFISKRYDAACFFLAADDVEIYVSPE